MGIFTRTSLFEYVVCLGHGLGHRAALPVFQKKVGEVQSFSSKQPQRKIAHTYRSMCPSWEFREKKKRNVLDGYGIGSTQEPDADGLTDSWLGGQKTRVRVTTQGGHAPQTRSILLLVRRRTHNKDGRSGNTWDTHQRHPLER